MLKNPDYLYMTYAGREYGMLERANPAQLG
jgi:hypothetical protein